MRPTFYTLLFAIVTMCSLNATSATKTVAQFNLNSYDGWTYTRTGTNYELNTTNISRLRIHLYGSYMLQSPTLDCSGLDSVKVNVVYAAGTEQYVANKLALTFALSDANGVTASVTIAAKPALVQQDMVAVLPITAEAQVLTLRALKADVDHHAAVRSVDVIGYYTPLSGDVNGDGLVDVQDVNDVINAITSNSQETCCDVNGDGAIDVIDINDLINMIL